MTQTFGWLPPEQRTVEQGEIHEKIVLELGDFQLIKRTIPTEGKRCVLWDYAKAVNGGKHIPTLYQKTGSCVGNGAWNAVMYLMAMEIARLGEAEQVQTIFLPYHYGRGRLRAGIRGRGEGSTGSGQAEAVMKDGVLTQEIEGLPKPSGAPDGLTWGASVEMEWSDGASIADKYIQIGVKHPVKSAALVTTYAQVRDAICNGYPVTVASNRGFEMATRKDRGKAWGVPRGQWNHQMCFIGVDDDPSRPGCYDLNSWSADAHGPPADDAPPGGFWVDAEVVDRMVRQGDSFAYSQFDGFPEQLDFNVVR